MAILGIPNRYAPFQETLLLKTKINDAQRSDWSIDKGIVTTWLLENQVLSLINVFFF